ncbi:hypothetical protein PSm6_58260 [Pseudomonas solani]|uniref:Uncharacterized protein n=1 Tax=Pseudomonas solani TaxID=2731552 RepID=A0ABN6C3C8_9PSED|nr:hypothetical protein PSm6_58260 [Pseudomonas solani]
MGAGQLQQRVLGQRIDHPADTGPVHRAGAHAAGFGTGVEGAFGQGLGAQQACGLGHRHQFGVLGRVAFRRHRVVAGAGDHLAVAVRHQGGEGVAAALARRLREADGFAQQFQVEVADPGGYQVGEGHG